MAALSPSSKSPRFTPIQESQREELDDGRISSATPKKRLEPDAGKDDIGSVSCNKCRPHPRDKTSVVPLDNKSFIASPNNILKSLMSSLMRKSPKPPESGSSTETEEQWKKTVAELSQKLIQATRKRDEALLEASRLKYSMAELEKKLNKLEIYCHNVKTGLDECNSSSPYRETNLKTQNTNLIYTAINDKLLEHFLNSVSESRLSVRLLSRSLTMQLRIMGGKVYERISTLLQPYDLKISLSRNPRGLLFYLEALLNKALYEDFESVGFQKNSPNSILNPIYLCESNYASFTVLKGLTWEEVLNKGTRHFSEDFSRFCDRKMSEIVTMLGWNRAWPEPLLQAFFAAAKGVWMVHLLASAVHPSLPMFRVEKEARFEPVYMEDMGGEKAKKLVPTVVRVMVAPGFYVGDNVVKCKVLCRYYSGGCNGGGVDGNDDNKGLSY